MQTSFRTRRALLAGASLFFTALGPSASGQASNLWEAVENGTLADVQAQLAKGADINEVNRSGDSPLIRSLIQARYDLLPDLLKLGADPNLASRAGHTPLGYAAEDGEMPAVEALIRAGANSSPQTLAGRRAFIAALYGGHPEVIQSFLKAGFSASAEIQLEESSRYPVHAAAVGSSLGVAILGKVSLDVLTNPKEPTYALHPLAISAFNDKPGVIRHLLQAGANPMQLTADGRSALAVAASQAWLPLKNGERSFEYLLRTPQPKTTPTSRTLLHRAAAWGRDDLLAALSSVAPSDPDTLTRTAIQAHDAPRLKQVIEDLRPDYFNAYRHHLFVAAARGNRAILDALHSYAGKGELLSELDANGMSQVHHAVTNPEPSALEFYLFNKRWVSPSLPDLYGRTPLMIAAANGNLTAINALHAAGVPLNQADKAGRTALDHAQDSGQTAASQVLQKWGATPGFRQDRLPELKAPPPPESMGDLPRITAAVLDFDTTEDVWFESTRTGSELAALLQARLAMTPNMDWVERSELAKVRAELELTATGLVSSAEALALGRLVKADVIIRGRVGAELGAGRSVTFQVLDARRGDVLAQRTHQWKTPLAEPWQLAPTHLSDAVDCAASALAEARNKLLANKQRRVIAPLFFTQHVSNSLVLDRFRHELPALFEKSADGLPFRVLHFDTEGETQDEAALALSGLADSMDAVRAVAHYFAWGACQVQPGATGSDPSVQIELHFWDGHDDPVTRSQTCPLSQLNATAQRLIQTWMVTAGSAPLPTPPADEALQRISQKLLEEALPLLTQATQSEKHRLEATQLLETARFFDPHNGLADACRLLARWNYNSLHSPSYSAPAFYASWRQLNAWRDHLDRHGVTAMETITAGHPAYPLLPVKPKRGSPPLAWSNYFHLLQGMIRRIDSRALGYLDTVPPTIRREMLRSLCLETASHLKTHAAAHPGGPPLAPALDYCEAMDRVLPIEDCIEIGSLLWKQTIKFKRAFIAPAAAKRLRACLLKWYDAAGQPELAYRSICLRDYASPRTAPSIPSVVGKAGSGTPPLVPVMAAPGAAPATSKTSPPHTKTSAYQVQPPITPVAFQIKPQRLPIPRQWEGVWDNFQILGAASGSTDSSPPVITLAYRTEPSWQHLVTLWQPEKHQFKALSPHPIMGLVSTPVVVAAAGQVWVGGGDAPLYRGDLKSLTLHPQGAAEKLPFVSHNQGVNAGGRFYLKGKNPITLGDSRLASWHPSTGWQMEPSALTALSAPPPSANLMYLRSGGNFLFGILECAGKRRHLVGMDLKSALWREFDLPAVVDPQGGFSIVTATDRDVWLFQPDKLIRVPVAGGEVSIIDLSVKERKHRSLYARFAQIEKDWLWVLLRDSIPKPPGSTYPFDHSPRQTLLAVYLPTGKAATVVLDECAESSGLIVTPSTVCPLVDSFARPKTLPFIRFEKANLYSAFGNTLR